LTADVLVPGGVHGAAPTGGAGANEYVVGAFYTPHLTAAATGARNVMIQDRELLLSLHILANLSTYGVARQYMRSIGIVKCLKQISSLNFSYGSLDCSLWLLQERHVALAMSQHVKLGSNSKLALLDPALMRLIIEYACDSEGCVVLAGCLVQLLEKEDQVSDSRLHSRLSTSAAPHATMISG